MVLYSNPCCHLLQMIGVMCIKDILISCFTDTYMVYSIKTNTVPVLADFCMDTYTVQTRKLEVA